MSWWELARKRLRPSFPPGRNVYQDSGPVLSFNSHCYWSRNKEDQYLHSFIQQILREYFECSRIRYQLRVPGSGITRTCVQSAVREQRDKCTAYKGEELQGRGTQPRGGGERLRRSRGLHEGGAPGESGRMAGTGPQREPGTEAAVGCETPSRKREEKKKCPQTPKDHGV